MKYSNTILKILGALIVAIIPVVSWAQPKDNSPYSRFGLGDLNNRNFYTVDFMGGAGAAFLDPYTINILNPASLSYLRSTAFDIGLYGERAKLSGAEGSFASWNGNLEYISLAFPLQNPLNDLLDRVKRDFNHGMAFTLMPYSTVGYDISSFDQDPDLGEIERNYQGTGGTYQFLFSNGFRYKNFSAGIGLGYLFGKITRDRNVIFSDFDVAFENNFSNSYSVSGFLWNIGFNYRWVLNKDAMVARPNTEEDSFTVGLFGNTKTGFSGREDNFEFITQSFTGLRDTFLISEDVEGNGTLPAAFGLGVNYKKGNKWSLSMDYWRSAWSGYENDFDETDLENASRVSFGGFYRPNYKSVTNYFSRVYYRFGIYYQTDPREIDSERIRDVGLSLGLGLPFFYQRKISHANLGLTIGRKGYGTPISEQYFRLSFSFTFNDDEWFVKRKFN